MTLPTASFALCCAAYLLLAALAATRWRARARGSALALAFLLEAAWSGVFAFDSGVRALPLGVLMSAEAARSLGWLSFLAVSLAPVLRAKLPRGVLRGLVVAATAAPVALIAITVLHIGGFALPAQIQRWNGLLASIAGLVLVEQFAHNAREDFRWNLKYFWLGAGILFACDLVQWSLTLLFAGLDASLWAARAAVNALVGLLFFVGLSRVPAWGRNLFRSSGILFFDTTLVCAGGYVLLMSGASFALQHPGQASRPLVEAIFAGAALVLLAVAAFSNRFRAWFRVTVAKRLLPYSYDYRDVWLSLTRTLSEHSEIPLHDRVAGALAALVHSNRARLWLRDADGQYRSTGGLLQIDYERSEPTAEFLEFMLRNDWIYDLDDAREDVDRPRHARAPPAPPPAFVAARNAWLVAPLICNGALVGFCVIGRPITAHTLGWEQIDMLRNAGRQVASYLALEQAATHLAEMHQFAALNRLSGFVMHDLRHLVAQLALVVENAARHRSNPAFIDDAISTIDSSVKRMHTLMEVLRSGVVAEPERRVNLTELGNEIAARCRDRRPAPRLQADAPAVEIIASRERLMHALEHLVRNAQDASPADGTVTIEVARNAEAAVVEIVDTGAGMDAEFVRGRLFKPFDSTKGEAGMGLGAYEAREIVRKLGGTLSVDSALGRGTRMRVQLPLAPPALA
jgi:putative PEP-CTERM system histidine kinase